MHAIGIWLKNSEEAGIIERKLELKGHKTYTGGQKAGRKYLSRGSIVSKDTKARNVFNELRV